MEATQDREGEKAQARSDVKSDVARRLIEAMETGNAPWQRPWSSVALNPINGFTGRSYRGVNRLLLSMSNPAMEGSAAQSGGKPVAGLEDNRWWTFNQAVAELDGEDKPWRVKKGAKASMIVRMVELGEKDGGPGARPDPREIGAPEASGPARMALRRYWVFHASQLEGPLPPAPVHAPFDPVARAEAVIEALKERTGLRVVHGRYEPCYVPSLDEVRLPPREAFSDALAMYSVAFHECAHATLHERRLSRKEAPAKRWGDEAYAMEELRAEIASCLLSADTGVPMSQDPARLANSAAYLRSWVKAIEGDPMAIFSAAKDADLMAGYMLELEREHTASRNNAAWLAEYDAEEERPLKR